jgi:hypothetical protein
MRRAGPAEAFIREHEWVLFILLVAYIGAVAAFSAWRAVAEIADHPTQRVWLVLALLSGLAICAAAWPTLLGVSSRHPARGPAKELSRSTRQCLVVLLSLVAVVAVLPRRTGPVEFWQPGSVQLLGSGFWLGFAALVLSRRVRQRAWRGFAGS